MIRSLKTYTKEGHKAQSLVFKRKDNYFKYYLLMFSSLFGFLSLLAPHFVLASSRMPKTAKKTNNIKIFNAFESCNKDSYFAVFSTILLRALLFISGILTIALIGGVLFFIGYTAGSNLDQDYQLGLGAVFAAPMAVVLIVYLIGFWFAFAPVAYVLDSHPELSGSKALYLSIEATKQGGKLKMFIINMWCVIKLTLTIALAAAPIVVTKAIELDQFIVMILGCVSALLVIIALFIIPKCDMARRVALVTLYEDMVESFECNTEETIGQKPLKTKNKVEKASKIKSKVISSRQKEELLVNLFTDGSFKLEELESLQLEHQVYKDIKKINNESNSIKDSSVESTMTEEDVILDSNDIPQLNNLDNEETLPLSEEVSTDDIDKVQDRFTINTEDTNALDDEAFVSNTGEPLEEQENNEAFEQNEEKKEQE